MQTKGNLTLVCPDTFYRLSKEVEMYQHQNQCLLEMQKKLEFSLMEFSELVENIPLGLLELNLSGLIVSINKTGEKLLNRKKNALINRAFSLFIDPEYQCLFSRYRQLVINRLRYFPCEVKLLRGEKNSFLGRLESKIIQDRNTLEKKMLVAITDITQSNIVRLGT